MFGIMGFGGAFINAAGRGGKKKEQTIILRSKKADIMLEEVYCLGEIKVISTKSGVTSTHTYTNLSNSAMSISTDANTDVIIIGALTKFNEAPSGGEYDTRITSISGTGAVSLEKIEIQGGRVESGSVSGSVAFKELRYRVEDEPNIPEAAARGFADMITNSEVANGDLYYNPSNVNSSIMSDAATAKGWTLHTWD